MIPLRLARLHSAYMIGGTDAGQQMYAFYPTAAQLFPVLPNDIEITQDTAAGSWGLAWYLGQNPYGQPRFAVRDDIVLSSKIGWHESGHALEEVLVRRRIDALGGTYEQNEDEVRTQYWNWREFPYTWQDALAKAMDVGMATGAGWAYLPGESVAESISAAVGGYVQSEWTVTYGKDLALRWWEPPGNSYDPTLGGMRARDFWMQIMQEVDMDEATVQRIAAQAAQEAVERYAADARATGFEPLKDAFNDHDHTVLTSNGQATDMRTAPPTVHLGNQ